MLIARRRRDIYNFKLGIYVLESYYFFFFCSSPKQMSDAVVSDNGRSQPHCPMHHAQKRVAALVCPRCTCHDGFNERKEKEWTELEALHLCLYSKVHAAFFLDDIKNFEIQKFEFQTVNDCIVVLTEFIC